MRERTDRTTTSQWKYIYTWNDLYFKDLFVLTSEWAAVLTVEQKKKSIGHIIVYCLFDWLWE